jgi:hypothetical protein
MSISFPTVGATDQPTVIPFSQLDTILASAEEALARAEDSLRRAQMARMESAPAGYRLMTVLSKGFGEQSWQ